MTNEFILRNKIKEKGLKLKFVAEELGLSPYGLARKIKNENDFTSTEILKLCDLLDIKSLREKDTIFFAKNVDLKSTKREQEAI